MIRINLMPQVRTGIRTPTEGRQVWTLIASAVLAGTVVLMGLAYFLTVNKLGELKLKNQTVAQRIEDLKRSSGNLEELKQKLERSQQLEEVVKKLERARLGPARLLRELIRILSQGGSPSIDRQKLEQLKADNPLAGYNSNWDVRRLWLTSFEEENRECVLKGFGKTNEDVAEFLRRLSLSDLFQDVTLQKTEATTEEKTKLPVIGFEVVCKVRY